MGRRFGHPEKAGLDPSEARRVVTERRFMAAVDREWAESEAAGITGVPTFEAGGRRRVVGAQPFEDLARLVESAGATRRSAESGGE